MQTFFKIKWKDKFVIYRRETYKNYIFNSCTFQPVIEFKFP